MISPFRRLRYCLEAIPVFLFYGLCAALPLDAASALGGFLGRMIGPMMGVSRRADRHLQRALPQLDHRTRRHIIRAMWDNLGRVGAEYPHLPDLIRLDRVSGEGRELIAQMANDGKPGIIIGGHLANWEIGPTVAASLGMPLAVIYRAPNNPYVDWLIRRARERTASLTLPKSAHGALTLLRHLRDGGHAGILIDQKLNEGIMVPFFGIDAATTPAPADIATRFQCPLMAARVERLHGAHFRMTLTPLNVPENPPDRPAATAALTWQATQLLEQWIRERPAEWLWIHNRWPLPSEEQTQAV